MTDLLNNVYLSMVTFTSLCMVPLASTGISDFHCLKPGSVSSAGISFLLCKTLQNFAACLLKLFSSSAHLQIRTRKRRTEGEIKDRDILKTRFYTNSQKQEKGKDKVRKKYSTERWSTTLFWFYDMLRSFCNSKV